MLVKGQTKENPETMSGDGNESAHSGNEYRSFSAKLKIDQPNDLVSAIGLQDSNISELLEQQCLLPTTHHNKYRNFSTIKNEVMLFAEK